MTVRKNRNRQCSRFYSRSTASLLGWTTKLLGGCNRNLLGGFDFALRSFW